MSEITKSPRGLYNGEVAKERLKRLVVRRFLRTVSDDADVTFCGRVFNSREAATGKAGSPMVE